MRFYYKTWLEGAGEGLQAEARLGEIPELGPIQTNAQPKELLIPKVLGHWVIYEPPPGYTGSTRDSPPIPRFLPRTFSKKKNH